MPRGDKTGPEGFGPMTGRRMGSCVGKGMSSGFRRGFNSNNGRGFGRNLTYSKNQHIADKESIEGEIENLKEQLMFFETELKKFS